MFSESMMIVMKIVFIKNYNDCDESNNDCYENYNENIMI